MTYTDYVPYVPRPDFDQHPAYGGMFRPALSDRYKALRKFIYFFFIQIKKAYSFKPKSYLKRPPFAKIGVTDDIVLNSFLTNGVVPLRLTSNQIEYIRSSISEYIRKVEDHKAKIKPSDQTFKDKVAHIDKSEVPAFYQEMSTILRDMGIIKAASEYRNTELEVSNMEIMVNHPDDPDWKNHFADIGLEDPQTSYMHFDSSLRPVKCLIYLSEVTEDTGPFMYVLGSNRINISWLEFLIRKANDKSGLDKCDPQNRKLFYALPSFLRKKSEFGNDLLNDSPETPALLENEKHFTSQDGNIFLIDTDGIHRGGMLRSGKRIMLHVLFGPTSAR